MRADGGDRLRPAYECVELVSRFFVLQHGLAKPFGVDANRLCTHARAHLASEVDVHDEPDYVADPGDAAVLAIGKYGHAGIVEEDLGESVAVFEQNGSRDGRATYDKTLVTCFLHARDAWKAQKKDEEIE